MKKTLRKYQLGDYKLNSSSTFVPYTGFSSNLAISSPQRYSSASVMPKDKVKTEIKPETEGGGGGASAMGYIGAAANLATGITETVMDANETIENIQTSQTGYNNYLRGEAANKILNLGKKEGSQLESSNVYKGSFDPNMVSQDIAHVRAIAQEKISKDSTSTGLSFIPFVGQIAAGINDAVWTAGMEERELTYQHQKAMSGAEQSSFGGTGEELRRGKYGGRMPKYQLGTPESEVTAERAWKEPGSTYVGRKEGYNGTEYYADPRFINNTTPGAMTRWVTKAGGKTPFQDYLSTPSMQGGRRSPSDTLLINDPRALKFDSYESIVRPQSRSADDAHLAEAFTKTYGSLSSLLPGNNPDPIDERYMDKVNSARENPSKLMTSYFSEPDSDWNYRYTSKAKEQEPVKNKRKLPKQQLGTYPTPSYALQYDTIPYVGTMKGPQLYNDPFADKKRYPVPNDVKFDTRDTLLGMRDRGMPLPKNAEYELGEELDPNFVGPSGRIPTTVDPKKMEAPNKYKMGGSRSYQEPNAELEDGEVIMRNGGGHKMIEGDRHEEGGEDEYLAPGDFVWSDHLKYKGKSMAELYLMVKDSPERVEQLKALQEDLASKEKPSKYNDLPQKKYGGELPKYQIEGAYRPYQLPTTEQTTPPTNFPFTRQQFNMFGKYPGGGTAMVGTSAPRAVVDQANAAAAAQALQKEKEAKAKAAVAAKANAAKLAAAKVANVPPTPTPTISVYDPAQGALKRQEKEDVPDEPVYTSLPKKAGRAPGTYSKARTMLNEYGRYIPQLAGSLAQIGMLAGMEDPYKDLTVPQAARVANSQFTPFGRLNNQAAEDQIREMYQAQLADARYRGAGPGDASQGQMAYNRAVQDIAESKNRTDSANINLAAQEASMNMEDKQRREVFNAAAINAQKESENANQIASANFGVQKSGALAGAFGTMGTDISKSIADKEYALAIYGNTSMNSDRYGINNKEVERLAKEAALKSAKAAGRTSATPQEELLEMVKLYDAMKTK